MAGLSTLKRLVRLGGWLGLSVTAMAVAACGAVLSSGCSHSSGKAKDAGPDVAVPNKPDAGAEALPGPDASTGPEAGAEAGAEAGGTEAGAEVAQPSVDAGQSDLWEIICE